MYPPLAWPLHMYPHTECDHHTCTPTQNAPHWPDHYTCTPTQNAPHWPDHYTCTPTQNAPTDLTITHVPPHRMPPTDLTMAAEESLVESGTSRGESQTYTFSVQPSMTAPVSLTGAPKGDSPKNGKTPVPMASTSRATEHRDAAREGMIKYYNPGINNMLWMWECGVGLIVMFPSSLTEQEAIAEFLDSMPMINEEFDICYKIGEGEACTNPLSTITPPPPHTHTHTGTFSSVYLASLKGIPEKRVAIKHLVPISSPNRIENEIYCLQHMGWEMYSLYSELELHTQ